MHIGKPHKRVEDPRLLTGRGRYVGDLNASHVATAAFLRSPHPHARIVHLSTEKAAQLRGVRTIITGLDWEKAGLGHLPIWLFVESTDGVARQQIGWPVIARDRVCFIGEIVAVVVATDADAATDAVEAIEIDYEPLPFVTDTARAVDPDSPLVHDEMSANVFFLRELGDRATTEAAFARADQIIEHNFAVSRVTANPMEPRASFGRYDAFDEQYTLYCTHQAPHLLRRSLAQHVLHHPEHKIRVVSPDVGGGFGMKVVDYPEDALVLWAARLTGNPVRWTATRSESFLGDAQGRDHATKARMALDGHGRILALEVDTIANLGAYQTHRGASIPGYYYGSFLVGLYRTPVLFCRVRGVHTNTAPVHAYRGAGRPEAAYVLERLLDLGARELGLSPFEIRERNLIPAEAFPYRSPLGMTYDSGDPPGLFAKLKAMCRYEMLREEQARLRAKGIFLGIGLAAGIDTMGVPSKVAAAIGTKTGNWDSAVVRVHPTGTVTVFAGTHSHGQGHRTTFAQLAADRLKCDLADIDVVEGDTDRVPFGHGTWGSRSTVTSGMAIVRASDRIVDKCRRIAAHILECAEEDLGHDDAGFRVTGTDRVLTFIQVVDAAHRGVDCPADMEPGLEETAFYDPVDRNVAAAVHLAVVLVDATTGQVTLRDYYAVDDCGTIINPLILEGQIQGGLAQGIGQALMEQVVVDPATGQLLSGSFMDYAMPRADDVCSFKLAAQETPTPHNLIGCKGGGESGTIASLPAMTNAVVDALWHLGVRHVEMPMTPWRVWQAIERASVGQPIS